MNGCHVDKCAALNLSRHCIVCRLLLPNKHKHTCAQIHAIAGAGFIMYTVSDKHGVHAQTRVESAQTHKLIIHSQYWKDDRSWAARRDMGWIVMSYHLPPELKSTKQAHCTERIVMVEYCTCIWHTIKQTDVLHKPCTSTAGCLLNSFANNSIHDSSTKKVQLLLKCGQTLYNSTTVDWLTWRKI